MKEITPISLPVSELKNALPGLSKIIGKGSRTLAVLQTVRVARDINGSVTLQATDLDSFATYSFKDAQPGEPVVVLVALDQLTKTTKGLKSDGTVGLTPEGKTRVKLSYSVAGNVVEQNIGTIAAEEFPPTPKITQPGSPLEPGFGLALKQALGCCSSDSSRYILQGACLDTTEKKTHYVVGTNGRQLFSANSFCFDLEKPVIIPDSKFLNWTDLMEEEPCTMSVEPGKAEEPAEHGKPFKAAEPGWIQFVSPRWTFITKEIQGQYPNWKQAVPRPDSKWTRIGLSEDAVETILQALPRLPGNYDPNYAIRLRAQAHQLVLEGRDKEDEAATSIVVPSVNVTGKPVTTALNRNYLIQALKFGLNTLEIDDALSPILFSNGGKKMVIMPVRLEGDAVKVNPADETTTTSEESTATTPTEEQTPAQENPEPPNERTEMPRRTNTLEVRTIENHADHRNGNGTSNGNGSAVKSVVDHIEQIRESLKAVLRDLSDVADSLKQAEKEKRTTEKEIDSIRNKLLQIQKVTI